VEVAQQEALLSDAIVGVRIAVAQQLRVLTAAATRIDLADVQVRLARQTLASEEAMHDAGRSLLQDVLEARAAVDSAEAAAVRARTDFRIATVELQRLQGTLDK
jgi:outer membrane protein TolC